VALVVDSRQEEEKHQEERMPVENTGSHLLLLQAHLSVLTVQEEREHPNESLLLHRLGQRKESPR